MNRYYVYKHLRLDTNECFYIGKGTKNRLFETQPRNQMWSAIADTVGFKAEKIADNLTEDDALEMERLLIKSYLDEGIELTNMMGSGNDSTISAEMKEKRAIIKKENIAALKLRTQKLIDSQEVVIVQEVEKVIEPTKLQYIQRKLSSKTIKISKLSDELNISRYILDKIAHGGEVRYSLVEAIYIHFKNSAE